MISLAVPISVLGSPLFLFHALATAITVVVLGYALRNRKDRSRTWFAIWLGANGLWIGLHTLALTVFDPGVRVIVGSLTLAAIAVAATCWLLFTLVYSGRWISLRSRAIRVVGVVTGAIAFVLVTNPIHGTVYRSPTIVSDYGIAVVDSASYGIGLSILLAYVFVLYLLGIGVLLDLAVSSDRLFRDQAIALVVAVAIPLFVAGAVMSGLSSAPVDLTPLSFTASAVCLAYVVFRSEVLGLAPATYRLGVRTAIAAADQGILVCDVSGRVVLANSAAQAIFGEDSESIVGRDVEFLIEDAGLVPVRSPFASRTRDGGQSASSLGSATQDRSGGSGLGREDQPASTSRFSLDRHLDGDGGSQMLYDPAAGQTYEVLESSIDERMGPDIGRTLLFRDATGERQRRERLLVLNRIVRHNLRNDMTVLQGHVDLLRERLDHDSVDVVGDIASDLVSLGEKAHEMDRVIQDSGPCETPTNVASVVDRIVADEQASTDVPIAVRGDVQAWTTTDDTVVRTIVRNLLEAAIERSTAGPLHSTDGGEYDVEPEPRDHDRSDESPSAHDEPVASSTTPHGDGAPAGVSSGERIPADRSGPERSPADRSGPDRSSAVDAGPAETATEGSPSWNSSSEASASGDVASRDSGPRTGVAVDVTARDDVVTLAVSDDGAPIPEQDVTALLEGELSALQQGGCIGLWMARWCVDIGDARWTIDVSDGNVITVSFPSVSDLQVAATGNA